MHMVWVCGWNLATAMTNLNSMSEQHHPKERPMGEAVPAAPVAWPARAAAAVATAASSPSANPCVILIAAPHLAPQLAAHVQ